MSDLTIEEAVNRAVASDPYHVNHARNDRLFGHDMLHALLSASMLNAEGEEITSIYQAVLLRDPKISTTGKRWRDADNMPSLKQMLEETIPSLRSFLGDLVRKYGLTRTRPALTNEQITTHYHIAIILDKLIAHEFNGRHLGEIPIGELKQCSFDRLKNLFERAQAIHAAIGKRDNGRGRNPA